MNRWLDCWADPCARPPAFGTADSKLRHFFGIAGYSELCPSREERVIIPFETVTVAPRADLSIRSSVGWRLDLWRRLTYLWYIKATFTTLGIGGFFVAYFQVMKHPLTAVTTMPLTALDHAIPFQPASLYVYLSLWVYVSLAPALLRTRRELGSYGIATSALSATGLLIFLIWPTAVPTFAIDWTLYPSIAFLKDSDQALNACPSMHVAFAVFTAMWMSRLLREMGARAALQSLNAAWCLAIVYSTISTRQHVLLDVVAGAAIGALVAGLHLHVVKPSPAHVAS